MQLTTCPKCRYEASDQAETCPNCDYPISEELESGEGGSGPTTDPTAGSLSVRIELPGEDGEGSGAEPPAPQLRGRRWKTRGSVVMVVGGILTFVGLMWLPWSEVTIGRLTVEGASYQAIYGGSLWVPLTFIGGGVAALFVNSYAERRIARWAGIAIIIVGLGGMWVLVDRAPTLGEEIRPGLFWDIAAGTATAILGSVIALVGADLVTIWAWVNRKPA